ncbi:hypothetical protein C834K_0684 [Chlamydia poikilotherma]|uniref:Uncharacterized protein n=1 Tax=Chlamydia poikilotherma TaxID=1967783 RepID=A0A3B0PT17_9CHLA|nr:hypothetical protein [Chlamydia poikilotherma]SYX09131.1 hypothetical protein C834K_0684 [Chlamydia poikilotherma]
MRITQNTVLIVNHRHTSAGNLDRYYENNKQHVVQNPLHRSCFESFLSYLPLFSTFTGLHGLLQISNVENALLLPTGGYSKICTISPCLEINEALPTIRKDAWLEIFGIKGLLTICQVVLKVLRAIVNYFKKVCGYVAPTSADIDPKKRLISPPKSAEEEIKDFLS